MLKENQLIKAKNMHSKSEAIAVVMSDQIEGKPIRVMSIATFLEYDVDVSQVTGAAGPEVTKDTPLNKINWLPLNK